MTSNVLTATELVAVLAVYCIVFCPILCWAIGGSASLGQFLASRDEHSRA